MIIFGLWLRCQDFPTFQAFCSTRSPSLCAIQNAHDCFISLYPYVEGAVDRNKNSSGLISLLQVG